MSDVKISIDVKKKELIQNHLEQQINLNTDDMAKVLIIGETGSGKSTLINYLINYFRGGTLDDIKIAIPSKYRPIVTENFDHSEKSAHDPSVSQTQVCRQYLFEDICKGNKQYLFVDTPGLGDVNGLNQDEINIKNTLDAVSDLGGLSAVIIVINGANIRLTLNLQTVLSQLWGSFPDTIMESVIVVLTNVKRHAVSFNLSYLKLHGNVYPIYMQNSAFSSPESWWTLASKCKLEEDWKDSMAEIQRMITIIDSFKLMSVDAFKRMINVRNEIKSLLHDTHMRLSKILQVQDEIHAYEEKIKQYDDDQIKFKDFTKKVREKREKVPAKYYSTICSNCNYVCHDGCRLEETTRKGDQIFQSCWALINRKGCCSCPQSCDYTQHYHDRATIIVTEASRTEIIEEIKLKYDQATKKKDAALNKINTIGDTKKLLEKALLQQIEEIKEECKKLKDICSNFDLSNELLIMINQIKAESLRLHSLEAKQQATDMVDNLNNLYKQIHEEYTTTRTKPNMNVIDNYISCPAVILPRNIAPSSESPQRIRGISENRKSERQCNDSSSDSDDSDNPAKRTIFVRNLPIDIKHEKIIDVFSPFGPIERHGGDYKVHLYTNNDGECTGAVLIQYENQSSAADAIKKYDKKFVKIFKTKIRVQPSDKPVMGAGGHDILNERGRTAYRWNTNGQRRCMSQVTSRR